MRRRVKDNGFTELVFERGDGALKRWAEPMQAWRLVSPENRKLAHAMEWYLCEDNLARRPALGMLSLAYFAEKLLYNAYKLCPGTRAEARAQRLFSEVQRKMAQLKYRGNQAGRVRKRAYAQYMRATVRRLLALATAAYDAVAHEDLRPKTLTMAKAME